MRDRPTLWQRFWRSPWTWMFLAANALWASTKTHGALSWCWLALGIIYAYKTFAAGDRKWGTP